MDPGPLTYAECRPPVALSDWVVCCWQSSGAPALALTHRVLPDGCTDLLLDMHGDIGWSCIGAMTTAVAIDYGAGQAIHLFGLRLRPGGLRRLLGMATHELTDQSVALDQLAAPLARALPAAEVQQRATLAERADWLWPRLWSLAGVDRDPLLSAVLPRLRAGPDGRGVAVLARDLGISERTLERRFAAHSGYTPVQFRRLLRFRRLLQRLPASGVPDWAGLALDAGYADQPHLVREFGGFAGVSPQRWWREQCAMGLLHDRTLLAV